jgi:hypothetical protein
MTSRISTLLGIRNGGLSLRGLAPRLALVWILSPLVEDSALLCHQMANDVWHLDHLDLKPPLASQSLARDRLELTACAQAIGAKVGGFDIKAHY